MDKKEVSRREVETRLKTMGDYVKIDYLQRVLKEKTDFDTRKFVLNTLASLYENKAMFAEAAKLMNASAEINATFHGKMNDYSKSGELFIKSGDFVNADIAYGKAIACGEGVQKVQIKEKKKTAYMMQAEILSSKDRRKHAMMIYEKILTFDLNQTERRMIQDKLLKLYEKLGKVNEFFNLKKSM